MDVNRLLANRRPRWDRLEQLLDRAEQRGLDNLAPAEAEELYRLFRLTASDLNQVQTRTGHPAVVDALEALVARGYAMLSVPARPQPLKAWWHVMRHRFPATVRAQWPLLGLATLTLVAGTLFGAIVTAVAPGSEAVFLNSSVGRPHLEQSPAERVAQLESEQANGGLLSVSRGTAFSAFLFTHNIRVIVTAFALGLTFGLGTMMIVFYTGAMLGSLGWLYWQDGVMLFFAGWIGPHGAIELPCVLFGAAAGLMLAKAQWQKEGGTVWDRIRRQKRALLDWLVGAATLLVLAGIIEGTFSQIHEPALPYGLKISVAALLFAGLLAYLFWMPVRPADDEKETA
jgi:uncharacterized membrane protein SpoIIM required for sporulation